MIWKDPQAMVLIQKWSYRTICIDVLPFTLKHEPGVPVVVAHWLMNPTSNQEVAGSIPCLAQWVKDLVLP